jgi:hypothetical protein
MALDRLIGFHASAARRLLLAAIYAALAFAAAWAVERAPLGPPGAAPAPAAPVADPQLVALRLETTYPVSAWTVQAGGKALAASASGAQHWEGRVPAGAALFVQADHRDASSSAPAALRWSSGAEAGVLWADGFVAATIQLPGRRP